VSKKELILAYSTAHQLERITLSEIRAIEAELRRQLGPAQRTSASYIATVLRAAGKLVEYEDDYTEPALPEAYRSQLEGVLKFRTLEDAEQSLRRLDQVYRGYRASGDQTGMGLVWKLVVRGKNRTQRLATSSKVNRRTRFEKQEIAGWFRVWLETPEIFWDWLELRKQTNEFQTMFGTSERPQG
jgi:hypothetical protein